jgi:hypothetical protein
MGDVMRKLSLGALLTAMALTVPSGAATAARVRIAPNGAITATSAEFQISERPFALFSVICELRLTGELRREAEGNLNVLGSIIAGRFERATVANCRGGTMRVELLEAATISVKEVTNGTRAELLILNLRILIDAMTRCLYEFLMRATVLGNPAERVEFEKERLLNVTTLAGSCAGETGISTWGQFTLNASTTFTLS